MSIIKKILILLIILTMCIPVINIIVYAHSVELETEGLISFPMFIMGGSGTVTIKDTIKDYKLYFQAIPVSDEIYLELQKNEPSKNEELKAIKGEYENLKKELDELKDKKDEYETKRIEYNNKINEYNNKAKELQEKQKELTPTYDEKDWKELTDNKFQIDLSQFEGNVAHAVWIKLVTSDNKTYYDEATYELSGTKKTTPNPTPSSEPDKEKLNTKLYVVKDQSETKYLENDQGYITKKIVDSNSDTGEVTIELKLNYSENLDEQKKNYDNTEIYIIVPENISTDEERLTKYTNNIELLSRKIFETNKDVKIGLLGMKGPIRDIKFDEDDKMSVGDNDQRDVNGSADNAEIVSQLTNDKNALINGLKNMNSEKKDYYSNLQAVIDLANKSFSNNAKRILLSLDDKIPAVSNGVCSGVSYGGLFSMYSTVEEVVNAKYSKISSNTRDSILSLKDSDISFILLRPDDRSYDEKWYNSDTGEKVLEFDGSEYVKMLYGTIEKPNYGKMYSFTDENIDNIISENIFNDIKKMIQNGVNNVKIIDYFPEDITENFDFSYVAKPNIGTISEGIDKETKTITWDIGNLKSDEEAVVKYKLKIKDMQNKNLLEKTISTNEKVVLTYKDKEDKDYTVTLTSSPQIKLSEVKEDEKGNEGQTNSKDPTVAPNKTLPNTGISIAIIGSVLLVIVSGIALLAKYHKLRDVK